MQLAAILMLALAPLAPTQADSHEPVVRRELVIYLDGNRESKILKSELTRDWCIIPSAELAIWDGRRKTALSRVRFAEVDFLHRDKVKSFPSYQWGDYGEIHSFDERAFVGSGTALVTVEALIFNFDLDLSKWKRQCDSLTTQARCEHARSLQDWVGRILPEEINATFCPLGCEYYEWYPDGVIERFGPYDGAPIYVAPDLPAAPLRKFPWESR